MSKEKRRLREAFKTATFLRDSYACVTCRIYYNRVRVAVDAHHIINRNEMPNGGYVRSNGISLCADCHEMAEHTLIGMRTASGWEPPVLYHLVGSTFQQAYDDSKRLAP